MSATRAIFMVNGWDVNRHGGTKTLISPLIIKI